MKEDQFSRSGGPLRLLAEWAVKPVSSGSLIPRDGAGLARPKGPAAAVGATKLGQCPPPSQRKLRLLVAALARREQERHWHVAGQPAEVERAEVEGLEQWADLGRRP